MAQLHRFVSTNDKGKTQVFTFLLSRKITKSLSPDIFTRDFTYGFQRWCLSFVRREKHVSVYLILKDGSDGILIYVDYSISLINREHFSKNETFSVKSCEFSRDKDSHGRKAFVAIDDLLSRKFNDGNSEFLVEIAMRNIRTTYEHWLPMPDLHRAQGFPKYETSYFTFGNYDWSVSMHPNGDNAENAGKPLVYLTRHTHFEHLCKLKYNLTLGEGSRCMDSDVIEHLFDMHGTGEGYVLNNINVAGLLTKKSKLKITMDLISVETISEMKIPVLDRARNCATCYDRDKQGWAVVSEFEKGLLKLRLFYSDARNIPRNYLRYVCWDASVVNNYGESVPVLDAPFDKYYVQIDCDEGYEMRTNIQENELRDAESVYIDEDRKLSVRIQWLASHLLLQSNYSKYDDIMRKHNYQMKREIDALSSENFSLEKQLYSYQQSIAVAHAKGNYEDRPGPAYRQDKAAKPEVINSRNGRPGGDYGGYHLDATHTRHNSDDYDDDLYEVNHRK